MSPPTTVAYTYDGTFAGFLTCVFESYVNHESPACFSTFADPRITLFPQRAVETQQEHAARVYRSLARKMGVEAQRMVLKGFYTCLDEREHHLYCFIRLGYTLGPAIVCNLTDDRVAVLWKALQHQAAEVHLLKGFVRFSQQGDFLVGEIEPKNRVLTLLQPHFCARYSGEKFAIYDRVHKEALFYEPCRWAIVPLEDFHLSAHGEEELHYRRLWRRFYDTIAIEGRYNPKLRMTHMPKRYWNTMTEFQTEGEKSPSLPRKEGLGRLPQP